MYYNTNLNDNRYFNLITGTKSYTKYFKNYLLLSLRRPFLYSTSRVCTIITLISDMMST